MSPYLSAYEAYHAAGEPYIPWTDALDFHLQHGLVISKPEVFLMARRVVMAWPDEVQVSFRIADAAEADGWHVWSAAGPLRKLLGIAEEVGARAAAFQRRTGRVHRYGMEGLRRR
jgi:hypothetical protein